MSHIPPEEETHESFECRGSLSEANSEETDPYYAHKFTESKLDFSNRKRTLVTLQKFDSLFVAYIFPHTPLDDENDSKVSERHHKSSNCQSIYDIYIPNTSKDSFNGDPQQQRVSLEINDHQLHQISIFLKQNNFFTNKRYPKKLGMRAESLFSSKISSSSNANNFPAENIQTIGDLLYDDSLAMNYSKDIENQCLKRPKLRLDNNHKYSRCRFLQILFSNAFVFDINSDSNHNKTTVYSILKMKPEMKSQLQQNARNIIKKYSQITRKLTEITDQKKAAFIDNCVLMYNPSVLKRFPFSDFSFHTAYVCTRPLDKGIICKLSNLKHWALKLEGDERLMTVGWFASSKSKNGKLQIRILCNKQNIEQSLVMDECYDEDESKEENGIFPPLMSSYSLKFGRNKCKNVPSDVNDEWFHPSIHRRIFWYWWGAQEEKENIWCRQRWTVLKVLDLKNKSPAVNGKYIGQLINRWRSNTYNGQSLITYDNATNNCQHFVRDIFAAFDLEMAKDLNSCLDASLAVGILPASKYADHFDQDLRAAVMASKLHSDVNSQILRNECKIVDWSQKQCSSWVMNIAGAYEAYGELFRHEGIVGKDLIQMNDEKLSGIGVRRTLHREKILAGIQSKLSDEEKCCIL